MYLQRLLPPSKEVLRHIKMYLFCISVMCFILV